MGVGKQRGGGASIRPEPKPQPIGLFEHGDGGLDGAIAKFKEALAGKHGDPRPSTVRKLAGAYGLTESQLRGDAPLPESLARQIDRLASDQEDGLLPSSNSEDGGRAAGWRSGSSSPDGAAILALSPRLSARCAAAQSSLHRALWRMR